jgi:SAM-dependent methyltransferase
MILEDIFTLDESSGSSLDGSFTRDLVFSKFWLMHELAQIQPHVSTMYVLGSWYGNLALFLNRYPQVRVDHIINVETDQERLDTSERMLDQAGAGNVEHMLKDANQLDYRQLGRDGAVVNTSLIDIKGTDWFENIPAGTLVVMQARDQVDDEQFAGPEDIAQKFPLDQMLYSGSLDLEDPETEYTRFMIIGRK